MGFERALKFKTVFDAPGKPAFVFNLVVYFLMKYLARSKNTWRYIVTWNLFVLLSENFTRDVRKHCILPLKTKINL